jgi:hypothetical protein
VDAKTALVTPSLPEKYVIEQDNASRWYIKTRDSKDGWMRYCIEDYSEYRDNNPYSVEKWDIRDTRWIAIERFPDFNTAYHFAVMYILTQE